MTVLASHSLVGGSERLGNAQPNGQRDPSDRAAHRIASHIAASTPAYALFLKNASAIAPGPTWVPIVAPTE